MSTRAEPGSNNAACPTVQALGLVVGQGRDMTIQAPGPVVGQGRIAAAPGHVRRVTADTG